MVSVPTYLPHALIENRHAEERLFLDGFGQLAGEKRRGVRRYGAMPRGVESRASGNVDRRGREQGAADGTEVAPPWGLHLTLSFYLAWSIARS